MESVQTPVRPTEGGRLGFSPASGGCVCDVGRVGPSADAPSVAAMQAEIVAMHAEMAALRHEMAAMRSEMAALRLERDAPRLVVDGDARSTAAHGSKPDIAGAAEPRQSRSGTTGSIAVGGVTSTTGAAWLDRLEAAIHSGSSADIAVVAEDLAGEKGPVHAAFLVEAAARQGAFGPGLQVLIDALRRAMLSRDGPLAVALAKCIGALRLVSPEVKQQTSERTGEAVLPIILDIYRFAVLAATTVGEEPANMDLLAACGRTLMFVAYVHDKLKDRNDECVLLNLDVLRHYMHDPSVAEACSRAIRNLVLDANNKVLIAEHGGLALLRSVLQLHTVRSNVVEGAAWALSNLALRKENKAAIAEGGGINTILACLQAHHASPEVTEACCRLLCNLATIPENKEPIAAAGGTTALLLALQTHMGNAETVEGAVWALCNLSTPEKTKSAIVDAGGVTLIVAAMHAHAKHAGVCQYACGVLQNLAVVSAHRGVIAAAGAIPPVVSVLSRHMLTPGVCEKACGCLRNLACNEAENKGLIHAADGIRVIVACLITHASSESVACNASAALRNLVATNANAQQMVDCGALQGLASVMAQHGGCDEVMDLAFGTVDSILRNHDTNGSLRIVKDECLPQLFTSLRHASGRSAAKVAHIICTVASHHLDALLPFMDDAQLLFTALDDPALDMRSMRALFSQASLHPALGRQLATALLLQGLMAKPAAQPEHMSHNHVGLLYSLPKEDKPPEASP